MSKLLAAALALMFSAHVAAASRDFQMVCPCEVELKSDSLAKVSFSLARVYENTAIVLVQDHAGAQLLIPWIVLSDRT